MCSPNHNHSISPTFFFSCSPGLEGTFFHFLSSFWALLLVLPFLFFHLPSLSAFLCSLLWNLAACCLSSCLLWCALPFSLKGEVSCLIFVPIGFLEKWSAPAQESVIRRSLLKQFSQTLLSFFSWVLCHQNLQVTLHQNTWHGDCWHTWQESSHHLVQMPAKK